MRFIAVTLLLAIVAAPLRADACATLVCERFPVVARATPNGLSSAKPRVVADTAFALARSSKPEDIAAVGRALLDPVLVEKVARADFGFTCKLPKILGALAANPAPEARAAFLALLDSPLWSQKPAPRRCRGTTPRSCSSRRCSFDPCHRG